MTAVERRTIVVTGATGLQGRAVTRHLLKQGRVTRRASRHACLRRLALMWCRRI
jgi:uncharacterized protein YbjT (DUF2867 family)